MENLGFSRVETQAQADLVLQRFSDTKEVVDLVDSDEVLGSDDNVDKSKFDDVVDVLADAIGVDESVVQDLLEKKIEAEGYVMEESGDSTSLDDASKASSNVFFSYLALPEVENRYNQLHFSNPSLFLQTPTNFSNLDQGTASAVNANRIIGLISEHKIRNYSIDGVCEKICRATGANFSVVESALIAACNFSIRRADYDQCMFSEQAAAMVNELASEAGAREASIVDAAEGAVDQAIASGTSEVAQETIDQRTTSAQDANSTVSPNNANARTVPDNVSEAIVNGVNDKVVLAGETGAQLNVNGIQASTPSAVPLDPTNPAAALGQGAATPPPSQDGVNAAGKEMGANLNFSNDNNVDAMVRAYQDMMAAVQY